MSATGGTGGPREFAPPRQQQNDNVMINTNQESHRERSTLGYSAYGDQNRGNLDMYNQGNNYVQRDVSEI